MVQKEPDILRQINLQAAIDSLPLGIAILDPQLRILSLNAILEALTGFSRDSAQGVYYDYILRTNIEQKGAAGLSRVLSEDETISLEGNIINRDRKKIPTRFTIASLKNNAAKTAGLIVTVEDLSHIQSLDKKMHAGLAADGIIGHSPEMQKIYELLPVLAQTDASALITGETGTGKDLVAEVIHNSSKRSRYPFIKVNCGALPEALLESELFGYSRGAFTGAAGDKPGMFRLAQGGTIFLTEIGDLPLPLQVKLLTVLDDKEFFPLGGSRKIKVDVRVITATHRDLKEYVRLGKFRDDLFYRLNVLRLHLPPVRDRGGDIRLLLDHFLQLFSNNTSKAIKGFDRKALDTLLNYPWPGNIREIRNVVEYAVTVCQDKTIQSEHLPDYLLSADRATPLPQNSADPDAVNKTAIASPPLAGTAPPSAPESVAWPAMEKKMIIEAMITCGGKRLEAAKKLGWARSTLWRKLKTHGLV